MRFVTVLDGTVAGAERRARGLGGFLREGLSGMTATTAGETLVCYGDPDDRGRLADLAPTADVRLVRAPPRRPDIVVAVLAALAGTDPPDLFLFDGGPAGTEAAARLAHRTGGSLLTASLGLALDAEGGLGRRSVYSGHMTGRFRLRARPWCVTVDASWQESGLAALPAHRILSEGDAATGASPSPFIDLELEEPAADDLAAARIVVVAGNGAGGRDGVARIAAAAARMGAAFGVTRPVAMNAWAPVDRLIGVSGKRVAPAVCIVAGASGAPAFLWGVERAGVIVAVNPDEHAPITRAADAVVHDDGVAVIEALADLVAGEPGAG